jgi:hypothetical protein
MTPWQACFVEISALLQYQIKSDKESTNKV